MIPYAGKKELKYMEKSVKMTEVNQLSVKCKAVYLPFL